MFNPWASKKRKLLRALWIVVGNAIVWIAIPYYLGMYLAKYAPSTPLAMPLFIYEFGILITVLQVGAALTDGSILWVPFASATSIVEAAYLWLATDGGEIAVSSGGIDVALGFRVLVLLLLAPPIWGALKAPLSYAIYRASGVTHQAPPP